MGDLHPCVTDDDLQGRFSTVGPVASARVARDARSGRPLGYGYVKTWNVNDAARMLDVLNFNILHGRPMRIMWCQPDPTVRKSGWANVYIKHLADEVNGRTLYDLFSQFGGVLSCKIQTDSLGKSKGFGFVQFDSQEAADEAISKIDGTLVAGRAVNVCRFQTREERKRTLGINGVGPTTNVFVKNFGEHHNDTSLHEMFAGFGEVVSARVFLDRDGRSKKSGLVCFAQSEAAQQAIAELNGSMVGENKLYVCEAVDHYAPDSHINDISNDSGCHVYVKHLTENIDEEFLKTTFSEFGEVTGTRVMRHRGRSRGFGFVSFDNAENASLAISRLHGTMLNGKKIYVSRSQTKAQRRQLALEHYQSAASSGFANSILHPAVPIHRLGIASQTTTGNQAINAGIPNTQMSAYPNGTFDVPPASQAQLEVPRSLVFHNSGQSGHFQQQPGQTQGQQAPTSGQSQVTPISDSHGALCYPWNALMAAQPLVQPSSQGLPISSALGSLAYPISGQDGRYNLASQMFQNRNLISALNAVRYVPAYSYVYGFTPQNGAPLQTMDCQNISEHLSNPYHPTPDCRACVPLSSDAITCQSAEQSRCNQSSRQTSQENTQATTAMEQSAPPGIMADTGTETILATAHGYADARDDPLGIFCLNLTGKSAQEQIGLIREYLVPYVELTNQPLATEVARTILGSDHGEILSLVRDRAKLDRKIKTTLRSLLSKTDVANDQRENVSSTDPGIPSENFDQITVHGEEPSSNLYL